MASRNVSMIQGHKLFNAIKFVDDMGAYRKEFRGLDIKLNILILSLIPGSSFKPPSPAEPSSPAARHSVLCVTRGSAGAPC
jgi:hypothetical protein